jgi:hypothetical protein
MENTRTPEQIAQDYTAALDSVALINDMIAAGGLDEEKKATITRNYEHLEIVIAREGWTTEDLTPLVDAVAAGKAAI